MTRSPYDLGGQARAQRQGERPATQAQIEVITHRLAKLEGRIDALERGGRTLKPESRSRIR
jgi:hypothetical protein